MATLAVFFRGQSPEKHLLGKSSADRLSIFRVVSKRLVQILVFTKLNFMANISSARGDDITLSRSGSKQDCRNDPPRSQLCLNPAKRQLLAEIGQHILSTINIFAHNESPLLVEMG